MQKVWDKYIKIETCLTINNKKDLIKNKFTYFFWL